MTPPTDSERLTLSRPLWLETVHWRRAIKPADTLSTVFFFDPIIRLVLPLFLKLGLSPNMVTALGFGVSLADAWLFLTGHMVWGGVLFAVWYVLDCIDGKIARLTGRCTKFGYWLDVLTDRLGTGFVLFGLGAQHLSHGAEATGFLALGMLFVWLVGAQNSEQLAGFADSFRASRVLAPEAAGEESAQEPSLFAQVKAFLGRRRLAPQFVQDVEWLMIAIALGPITGNEYECLLIGLGGMALQRTLQTLVFWWRRRAEISTVP